MNNTFSLEQISRAGTLDANLLLRQHKLDLMARFMDIKSVNQKLKQKEIARELGFSISTSQRYRQYIKSKALRNQTILKNVKGPHTTSKDLKRSQKSL